MKLKEEELKQLKHFSTINDSIIIKPGNRVFTQGPSGRFAAQIVTEQEFPVKCGILSLKKFLSVLDLVGSDAELNFNEDGSYVEIAGEHTSARYKLSNPEMLEASGKSGVSLPSEDVKIAITEESLKTLKAAAAAMEIKHIIFRREEDGIVYGVVEKVSSSNETSDVFKVNLGNAVDGIDFSIVFEYKMLNLPTDDYMMIASEKGIAQFTSASGSSETVYWVGMHANGTYFNKGQ